MKVVDESSKIESTIAVFRNFSCEKPIEGAVIYYCESHPSHEDSPDEKEKHQATIELTRKTFDLYSCEKYEVRSGYLNRYNYLSKPMEESSLEEIEEAINKGENVQNDWLDRVKPELPEFKIKDWRECISEEDNIYFKVCKKLVVDKIQQKEELAAAVERNVTEYVDKHGTNLINANAYVVEELSWILSLPLLHLNKPIYLIHVGFVGDALKVLFAHFPDLQKAVKWMIPKINTAVFENEYDFLMNYRNAVRVGYSYAMINKEIVRPINTFIKENNPTKGELTAALSRLIDENNMLLSLIDKLPAHVYWLNRDNVCLGCNDFQAKKLGFNSRHEVIGKASRELYSEKDADIIEKNNIKVMETGIAYKGEEISVEGVSYLTHKTPIYDVHGKVTGLLGISIDITDRKRVEELEIENKVQLKIKNLSEQVAHDIQAPLACLSGFANKCAGLSESDHLILTNIINTIHSISAQLIFKYDDNEVIENLADPIEQYISVQYGLLDVIDSKKCQYSNLNIDFNFINGSSDPFVFINGDFSNYCRMMSNLINNAIESMDGKPGKIDVGFDLKGQEVEIYIKDYGKGMPSEVVDKILNGIHVVTTKKNGHGIGLEQIKKTIKQMNGKMRIESKENEGTKIVLQFKRSKSPPWFVEKIVLPKGFLIIILDDDLSMHDFWQKTLEIYKNDITVKYFVQAESTIDFIKSLKDKSKVFLIADYDLRNQNTNGIEVIEQCGMQKNHILATGCYISRIKDFSKKAEYIQLLLKSMINIIPVTVEETELSVVVLDDSKMFADMVGDNLRDEGIDVDVYYRPNDLLANISRYSINTKVIMDNDFKSDISGESLARQLSEHGFKNICLLTGVVDADTVLSNYPAGTIMISKGTNDFDEQLLLWCKESSLL